MTRFLLDTNVLIAMLWPRHVDQSKVVAWFSSNARGSFASCSLTQAGFVRVSCSYPVENERFGLAEATALLRAFTGLPGHAFWPTTIDLFEAIAPFERRMHGPKQVTDAYLLGLVRHHGGKLATLDKAILALAGPEFSHLVELIA
ncbi:MAG: TA system VapC family ribonuclease toxin [Terracidiphilus sp.]